MAHKFTPTDQNSLQGIWFKPNGRRLCSWHFNPGSATLQAKRGLTVHTATLETETHSLDELKAQLPEMALLLSKGKPLH